MIGVNRIELTGITVGGRAEAVMSSSLSLPTEGAWSELPSAAR